MDGKEAYMLSLQEAREAILRDMDASVEILERLDASGWERATPCEGWTIRDLATHLVDVVMLDADILRKRGTGTPAEPTPVAGADLASELRDARKAYAELLDGVTEESLNDVCTFQAGSGLSLPLNFTLQVSAMEFGTHRNDLERALGAMPRLQADTVRACTALATGLLPFLANGASETPSEGTGYTLRSPGVDASFVYREGAWQPGSEGTRVCTIEADDETLSLFALGRIPASDVRSSDPELASKFKTYFPGP
jgi:uncharacterized protein (TIGR03083 family)